MTGGHMSDIVEKSEPFQQSHAGIAASRSTGRDCTRGPECTRRSWYPPVKFAGEWILALILLIVTAPLSLLLAILVKCTSSGPIFYAQTRLGLNGRIFRMFKFRTMVQNAESGTGPVWAAKNDCRITPVGRILRQTHLDELPQLWNVLRGEMSLIGPRPERPEIAARIARQIPEFRRRLAVRPGVTGLSQMLLPADDPSDAALNCVQRKLAHDLVYIRKFGFMMDLRISMSTPCYFLSAAVQALQQKLVRCYEVSEESMAVPSESEDQECREALVSEAAR
jgi:lipopolysaccharide/colanic/teichoic acid biosynthesis glycosyltransferase